MVIVVVSVIGRKVNPKFITRDFQTVNFVEPSSRKLFLIEGLELYCAFCVEMKEFGSALGKVLLYLHIYFPDTIQRLRLLLVDPCTVHCDQFNKCLNKSAPAWEFSGNTMSCEFLRTCPLDLMLFQSHISRNNHRKASLIQGAMTFPRCRLNSDLRLELSDVCIQSAAL